MDETLGSTTVSTKRQRLADLAKRAPGMVFTTLAHHIDRPWLKAAYRAIRKDGATGVDGQTAEEYAAHLEHNLASLLERFKAGTYWAPPVRRVEIPKGDGRRTRPIGIPTVEDKVLQRAVVLLLDAIYEQDFRDSSYGFRPGRSAHQALSRLQRALTTGGGGWVYEVDIQGCFDTLDHGHLRRFLDQRVRDGVVRRTIDKWLKAGVLEGGVLRHPELGTPQGGVISPLLANLYLHEVLDTWFEDVVRPRLRGRAFLIRYADDFVIGFTREDDARRVVAVLPKRFGKYGLTLHPDKTRLIPFRPPGETAGGSSTKPGTFDFLGFTHYWRRSRRGTWVVGQKTAKGRFSRALKRVQDWCRVNRHRSLAEQQRSLRLKLRGHYGYYGVTGNLAALKRFAYEVHRRWQKWLNRRSQRAKMPWECFQRLLERYPLPKPTVVHSIYRHAANP